MTVHRPIAGSRHILTVALEDYYQVGAFNSLIQRGEWYRFETRIERNTTRVLDLLDAFDAKATFFTLGWVADQLPELLKLVSDRGHEISSKGYYHRSIRHMTPEEFRDDLARAREALQRASGQRILGYRVADEWFRPSDLWALDVLAEEGYEYDSSLGPIGRQFAAEPWRRFTHAHHFADRTLWEFPISATELAGFMVPIAGGNWFRQLPPWLVSRAVEHWVRTYTVPYVMYFHAWEMDPDPPMISAATWLQRVRTYRHIDQMPTLLRHYLGRYRFTSAAQFLGLATQGSPPSTLDPTRTLTASAIASPTPSSSRAADRLSVTIVVPCYNEELILPYLANTLRSVEAELAARYDMEFILIDDASADDTVGAIRRQFGTWENCHLVRHGHNVGVAGGILTGLQHASNEVVCSIDCDCTYDPHMLAEMIPRLVAGVDLVTASPYHPEGHVLNVPSWRLALSRSLSALYRLVLHHKLHTYTSCFRVYRRSTVLQLQISQTGFLGVAELLGRLDLAGGTVVEFPTTLQVRVLGRSKMRVLRTILGHLALLARLALLRISGTARPLDPPETPTSSNPRPAPHPSRHV